VESASTEAEKCRWIPFVVPVAAARFTSSSNFEEIEEIRLTLLVLIKQLISSATTPSSQQLLDAFVEEIVNILKKCLTDPFDELRKVG
jgi:hypothetical protein